MLKVKRSSKFKQKNSFILMIFLRKLIQDLPRKRLVFQPRVGKILSERVQPGRSLIAIKDPFIKEINWASKFTDSCKLSEMVGKLKDVFGVVATSSEILQKLFVDQQSQPLEMTDSNESDKGDGSNNKETTSLNSFKTHKDTETTFKQI